MLPWYQAPVFWLSAISAVSTAVLAAAQTDAPILQWIFAGVTALIAVVDSFTTTGKV